ncbi:MAG: biotin--[acetyl-CoA-carboxylase] ligase [Tenacibaculum sp.]
MNKLKIIKLNAIDSTNLFLKKMAENSLLENYTTVLADEQNFGTGQRNTKWVSERGKNLICSVFVKLKQLYACNQRYLNFAVSISIYELLSELGLPKLTVKWPNDILTAGIKLCGILVENKIKGNKIQWSVIGIGLNVNQSFKDIIDFEATSIKDVLKKEFDLSQILSNLLIKLRVNISYLSDNEFEILEQKYLNVLYKKNITTVFKTKHEVLFEGKIIGVSKEGKLQIKLSDKTVKEFGIKEVAFA